MSSLVMLRKFMSQSYSTPPLLENLSVLFLNWKLKCLPNNMSFPSNFVLVMFLLEKVIRCTVLTFTSSMVDSCNR